MNIYLSKKINKKKTKRKIRLLLIFVLCSKSLNGLVIFLFQLVLQNTNKKISFTVKNQHPWNQLSSKDVVYDTWFLGHSKHLKSRYFHYQGSKLQMKLFFLFLVSAATARCWRPSFPISNMSSYPDKEFKGYSEMNYLNWLSQKIVFVPSTGKKAEINSLSLLQLFIVLQYFN